MKAIHSRSFLILSTLSLAASITFHFWYAVGSPGGPEYSNSRSIPKKERRQSFCSFESLEGPPEALPFWSVETTEDARELETADEDWGTDAAREWAPKDAEWQEWKDGGIADATMVSFSLNKNIWNLKRAKSEITYDQKMCN